MSRTNCSTRTLVKASTRGTNGCGAFALHEKAVAVSLRTAEEANHVLAAAQNCSILELSEPRFSFDALRVVIRQVGHVRCDQSLRQIKELQRFVKKARQRAAAAPFPRRTRASPAPPPDAAAQTADS